MRVTIEPTKFNTESNIRTIMESYSDDLDLHAVMTDLIAPALIGWGFHPASVYEYIERDYSDNKTNDVVVDAYNYSVKPFRDSWKDEIYNNSKNILDKDKEPGISVQKEPESTNPLDRANWGLEEWKE